MGGRICAAFVSNFAIPATKFYGMTDAPLRLRLSICSPGTNFYSALMLASLMTFPHLAVSATMYGPNSAGPNLSTSAP